MIRALVSKVKLRHARFLLLAFGVFLTGILSLCFAPHGDSVSAASLSGFKAGNIMSNAVMSNYNSMSLADIQNFLTKKNPCNNTNYSLYTSMSNRYPNIKWHWDNNHFVCLSQERFGDGTTIGSGQTAAEIIYGAAQANHINPQVLIVLLEKEQGLITDTYPHSGQYRAATGYGCPDTAACDSKYYGFKNQVYRAAELFRYTLDHGYSVYPTNKTVNIKYNPSASCGTGSVHIENNATAALYRYTPYQPNAAALAAGYGLGDSCSSYGNRNFYMYFTDWFGSTQTAPLGVSKENVIIPDGTYTLASKQSENLSLGAQHNATANGSNVLLNTAKTQWTFKRDPQTGYYTITDKNSGKVLDLSNSITNSGSNIQIWSHDIYTCAQKWKTFQTNDGGLVIETACASDMAVSMSSVQNSANIQLDHYDGGNAQKWKIIAGQTISDGIYTMQSTISSRSNVDIRDISTANGSNVHLWEDNQSSLQKWQFTYANGYYTIKDVNSNKVLDLSNAKISNGANLQIWAHDPYTCAQKWQVVPRAEGGYTILSACSASKAVDLSNASVANGANIQLWSYDPYTKAQRWNLVANPILADGTYTIRSRLGSNKAIDLSNAGTTNGTNIQSWSYDSNTAAQKWNLKYDRASGTYTITNAGNNKAIDVSNARMANGTNIQLWAHDPYTCAQKWYLIEAFSGVYSIHSACQVNYVIDVAWASLANGANLQLTTSSLNNAQRWNFSRR